MNRKKTWLRPSRVKFLMRPFATIFKGDHIKRVGKIIGEEEGGKAKSLDSSGLQRVRRGATNETNCKFKICVGVPVYNEELYIEQSLSSLKRQRCDNVQFIISDNCSTDKTLDVCRDISNNDERFHIIKQSRNMGSGWNFRFLYDLSDCEYFMWLGSHDYISDNFLQNAMGVLDKNPEFSMISGAPYAIIGDSNKGVNHKAIYNFFQENCLDRYINSVIELFDCTIFHSVFRRNLLSAFQFRQTISQDHVLISRLLWGGKLHYMEREKYYRRYFTQINSTSSERITGKAGSSLGRYDFYKYYLDDFSSLYKGDPIIKSYLQNKILGILEKRFGGLGLVIGN